jgi:hypothetical protein
MPVRREGGFARFCKVCAGFAITIESRAAFGRASAELIHVQREAKFRKAG